MRKDHTMYQMLIVAVLAGGCLLPAGTALAQDPDLPTRYRALQKNYKALDRNEKILQKAVDDLKDALGDSGDSGKSVGRDTELGRPSLVAAHATLHASRSEILEPEQPGQCQWCHHQELWPDQTSQAGANSPGEITMPHGPASPDRNQGNQQDYQKGRGQRRFHARKGPPQKPDITDNQQHQKDFPVGSKG